MLREDIWSSLRMPSGMGCTTAMGAEEAAWAAAKVRHLFDLTIIDRKN